MKLRGRRRQRRDPRRRAFSARASSGRGVALALVALVAVVVALAATRSTSANPSPDELAASAVNVVQGLPQSGIYLGSFEAPARLVVFADVTSVRFARFNREVMPELVRRWVRPGKLQLQFQTVEAGSDDEVPGSEADVAPRVVQAAGIQDKLWQYVGAFAARYVGVIGEGTLDDIAQSVPGLDRAQLAADSESPRVLAAVARNAERAAAVGPRQGMALLLRRASGSEEELTRVSEPADLIRAVDRVVTPLRPGSGPVPTQLQVDRASDDQSSTTTPDKSTADDTATQPPPTTTEPEPAPDATTGIGGDVELSSCEAVVNDPLPVRCEATSALLSIAGQNDVLRIPGVRAQILGVEVTEPTTASAIARKRMRVSVRMRISNSGSTPIFGGATPQWVYLSVQGRRTDADPAAEQLPEVLRQTEPLEAGSSRTGILRFETAGAVTQALRDGQLGEIGIRTDRPVPAGEKPWLGVIRFALPS